MAANYPISAHNDVPTPPVNYIDDGMAIEDY